MGKKGFILGLVLLLPLCLRAQEAEDNTFGGWEFIEVNHDFGESPFFGSFYFAGRENPSLAQGRCRL